MSIKNFIIILSFTIFSITTISIAGNSVPDYIEMNTPEYSKHTKGLVNFSHKNHSTNYVDKCGECHHDSKGVKLELKIGDEVESCVSCHKETGKMSKEEKLSKKEKINKYHKEAIHSKCKKCHKTSNEKKQSEIDKIAPTKCKECHPKIN